MAAKENGTGALKAACAAFGALPYIAIGAYAANAISGIIFPLLGIPSPPQAQVSILMDPNAGATVKATICFAAIVFAPLFEEAVFRFGAYRTLMRDLLGWKAHRAAVMSAILFAAVHMHIPALPALAFVGYMLARLYERTGTLLAPIICHSLFNALNAAICLAYAIADKWLE